MGVVEWGAIVATCMLLLAVGGKVWALATKISAVESKAESASTIGAAASMRVETVAKILSEHKESIAQNYVSNKALESLENRLVDAIGKLGDRIDRLFMAKTA